MKIIFALLIFEVIIVLHELGHFVAAKACGVKVNEFAIGMGPAIIKKKKGETLYAWRILPIGGYCAMEGEDANSSDDRAFNKKSLPKRMIIVLAGITMNLILGFILLIIYTVMDAPITSTTVSRFENDTAVSHSTGLEVGDEIIEVNGMHIFTDLDLGYQFQKDEDGVFDMVVIRDGEKKELKDVKFDTQDNKLHIDFYVEPVEATPSTVLSYSFRHTITDGRLIYITLIDLVRGKYSIRDLSGPVGIVDVIGDVIESETTEEQGINWHELTIQMLNLAAFITINIGLFNLLPLPALDGGRLIFLIIEAIRGKPVPPEKEGMVHLIGMAALLLLMVIVTVSDIMKLFG
ncbi:MAG: site-2 protease family protein [Ruminococcus sp.]|nr:site-2 protease family protein [Ruminococcus sp.]